MDANKKQEFAMVDFDYSLALANIAFKNGAKKISIVSAAGADANSFNYYAKIKVNWSKQFQTSVLSKSQYSDLVTF